MSSPAQVLGLYRQILKEGKKFKDFNFKEYSLRRTREAFRDARNEKDPSKLQSLFAEGNKNLALLQRQTTIHNMYHVGSLVIEKPKLEIKNGTK